MLSEVYMDINVTIEVKDLNTGHIINTIREHNKVTQVGFNLLRDFLGRESATGLSYFAVGTGTTAVTTADIKLETENYRNVLTSKTYSNSTISIKYYLTSGESNGVTLSEAGLFGNVATAVADSGTLFSRVTHPDIVKTASIAITYTWDITFS